MPRSSIHTFISFPTQVITVEHELDIDILKIKVHCCTTFNEVNKHLALYFGVIQCELVHKSGIEVDPSQKIFEFLNLNQNDGNFVLRVNTFMSASL